MGDLEMVTVSKELLIQMKYIIYQYECIAPLFLSLTKPYHSDEAKVNAEDIQKDIELANKLRETISKWLQSMEVKDEIRI